MRLTLYFKVCIVLITACFLSAGISPRAFSSVALYKMLSENKALEMWKDLKRVELGKEITISNKLKGTKLEFTNTRGETTSLLLLCKGICKPAPCGTKPWRYGCNGTDKCERKEFKLTTKLIGRNATDKWLYSFTKDEEYLINKQ